MLLWLRVLTRFWEADASKVDLSSATLAGGSSLSGERPYHLPTMLTDL